MKHFTLTLLAAAALTTATAQNRVTNLSTNTQRLNTELIQQTDQTVQLNRYLFAGYNTLCLPMSVGADQLGDLRLERLAAIAQDGETLNLYFVDCTDEGITAGMPYLVYSPEARSLRLRNTDATTTADNLVTVRMADSQGNQVTFASSWQSITQDGRYGIPAQQDTYPLQSILVRTEADKTFLPTRCGFVWETQSPTAQHLAIQHVTPADVTAIQQLNAATGATVDVYDLKGNVVRRQAPQANALSSLPAGVYVVGGEKVVVR